jgi:uncharacterized protein with PIN domain
MVSKKDDWKAKLLEEAEASIEKMVSDKRVSEQMTITEIEDVIVEWEMDFRQRVLKEAIGNQEEPDVTCAECGGKLRNKGKSSKRLVTLRGETAVDRSYYQCETCSKGVFPPG